MASCITFNCHIENGPPYSEKPRRLAGTCMQYSKNAIPQLIKIIPNNPIFENLGIAVNRKWPYHANVIKTFESVNKIIV